MTWYTETAKQQVGYSKQQVDYSKPICAEGSTGITYLLLPTNYDKGYNFRGYDWFNPATGKWNSCVNHRTAEKACSGYRNVRNCSLNIWED